MLEGCSRTLTNDEDCPLPPPSSFSPHSLSHSPSLLPTDQQGVGSGRFPGSQRGIPPGAVALGALHRVRNHHVHLRHRRVDLLPVRQATVKKITRGRRDANERPLVKTLGSGITRKCKIASLSLLQSSLFNVTQLLRIDGHGGLVYILQSLPSGGHSTLRTPRKNRHAVSLYG